MKRNERYNHRKITKELIYRYLLETGKNRVVVAPSEIREYFGLKEKEYSFVSKSFHAITDENGMKHRQHDIPIRVSLFRRRSSKAGAGLYTNLYTLELV